MELTERRGWRAYQCAVKISNMEGIKAGGLVNVTNQKYEKLLFYIKKLTE